MLRTIQQVLEDFNTVIPLREIDNWRPLYPNGGYVRGQESRYLQNIVATNGCLALFHTPGRRDAWLGHLANFIGPVAKEFVPEEDWDWERNCRKVKVFRRKDGSCAIIPQDTLREEYFAGKSRLSQVELELYAALGATWSDPRTRMLVCEFEDALDALSTKPQAATPTTSARKALLASL